MPKTSEMIQSKFLKKDDFPGPRVMTIRDVKLETMPGDQGDQKWVLYFREDVKGLALNVTKIRTLERAFGDDTDHWIGNRVKVSVDPDVVFGGKVVGGLRLQTPSNGPAPAAPKPAAPAPTGDFDDDLPF